MQRHWSVAVGSTPLPPPICLVCENETLIAFDLETCLVDIGLTVVGPFTTGAEALRWIEKGEAPDMALLNFRLNDGSCAPLVQALRERGVPIVIQSGLKPDADMPPEVRDLPWLSKPVSDDALRNALAHAVPALSLGPRNRPVRTSDVRSKSAFVTKGRPLTHVLIKRLAALCPLSEAERKKLEAAVARTLRVDGGQDIVCMGEQVGDCHVLLSGMAAPYKLLSNGRRQITRFCVPGDFIDLDGFVGGKMDHHVAALGQCDIGVIPHRVLRDLSREHPAIALALWRHTLADTAVFREWVVNVGQRSAPERIAHVVCEVFTRLRDAGLATETSGKPSFQWPVTQGDIAHATGMTPVHVNRCLQELRGSRLIELSRNKVTILDWSRLSDICDFETDYLFPTVPGSEGLAYTPV